MFGFSEKNEKPKEEKTPEEEVLDGVHLNKDGELVPPSEFLGAYKKLKISEKVKHVIDEAVIERKIRENRAEGERGEENIIPL